MKRLFVGVLAGALVLSAGGTGVALAASSPTVITGAATAVINTSAVVHARVNPNGNATTYAFDYGPTAAYGAATVTRRAGAGARGVDVAATIGGLTPGTIYHYRITALNRSGQTTGADSTFKTTGAPPSVVVTGPAVNVRKTVATPTGSVDPNGAPTTWAIQYGLTTGYGLQTYGQAPLSPVTTSLPVSVEIQGLAPATLFHYRVIAYHGGVVSYGLDSTFFTEPDHRPKPHMTARTTPARDKRAPYTFTTNGTLHGAGFIPAAQRCTGSVGIRYYNGRRQVAYVVAGVGSDCKFSGQASFRKTHGRGAVRLKLKIDYRGNGYLAPVNRTAHVIAG